VEKKKKNNDETRQSIILDEYKLHIPQHERVGEIVTELGMTMYPSYARFEWYIETSCCSKRSVGCYIHEMILGATPHYH